MDRKKINLSLLFCCLLNTINYRTNEERRQRQGWQVQNDDDGHADDGQNEIDG